MSLLRPNDLERNTVTVARLQDVDQEIFARLKANDILFIDSSHVAKIGSDLGKTVHLLAGDLGDR